MSTDALRVTAVVPVHDNAVHLAETLDAIVAQTHPVAEVLVVDDGSTDGSADIARTYGEPVRVLRQANAGQGAARNTGARVATGNVLAFCDHDDLWLPDKIERQLELLARHPGRAVVFGGVEQFYSPELGLADRPVPLTGFEARGVLNSALLVRAEAFWAIGPYREDLRLSEGLDWYDRARAAGHEPLFVDGVVFRRRIHGANLGLRFRAERAELARVLKAKLDRERAGRRP